MPQNSPDPRGSNLESFKAEVRRSWFSVRQSLKGITSKGRLWLPATVVIADGFLRVSTTEGIEELRPRKLVWKGPDRFTVAGFDGRHNLHRVSLRFETTDLASTAASALKDIAGVIEELLPPVEEFQVLIRSSFTITRAFTFIYVLFMRLFVVVLLGTIVFSALGLLAFLPAGIIIFYLAFFVWAILSKKRRFAAFLRFEGSSLAIRTAHNREGIIPKSIEWRNARTLILRGSGLRLEVSFSIDADATRAVEKLRLAFPELSQIQVH